MFTFASVPRRNVVNFPGVRQLMLLRQIFLTLLFSLGLAYSSFATHLRAGEITVERVSCNSLTFRITVTVFTDSESTVLFGGEDDWLDFGDGQRMLVPQTLNTIRADLGPAIATASFTVLHTYSGFQAYTISYSEPNRNQGVINMDGSVNTRFYIETRIIVDPFLGCNNTPKLLIPPIDRGCTGVAWFHNPGAFDPDGDSLSYEIVTPYRDKNSPVVNYRQPNDPRFYSNINQGNENGNGPPTFNINPTDGTITWDAPGPLGTGEYNVAFHIIEWRRINGVWFSMGFVRRDMQIIVEECSNERPDLIVPDDICVVAGTQLTETILGIDPDNHNVKIEAFSEIFNFAAAQSPATYTPKPAVFQSSNPPAELNFEWNTECHHVKDQPYQVVFKITDSPPMGPKLVTFKTWFIRVVGPEPEWEEATVDLATRNVSLEWDPYVCTNADKIQIWRKVDSLPFEPDSCQTGMPEFLGYSLIATVDARTAGGQPNTTYLDDFNGIGAAFGAQYCYRLVALYPLPKGGESYVSDEICIDPILAEAPVIVNVSVERTATTNGRILVRWTRPFELSRTQFPDIEYEVYRADGFSGETNLTLVSGPTRLNEMDTVIVDDATELNTRDLVYNYRVRLYATTSQNPSVFTHIETSASASTVRLETQSEFQRITLDWSAIVPWSNVVNTTPNEHVIYRGPAGSDESTVVQIATVDPTTLGFTYVDAGLNDEDEFCYRVMTRGAYGNPEIKEPLENFSQIVCATPNDSIPPCTPHLNVQLTDCEQFLASAQCDVNSFVNTLEWERPSGECGEDILGYKIYRSATIDGEYIWLHDIGPFGDGIVRDTRFQDGIDNNSQLNSLAYCYRISAVDRSGNESELSAPVCNDNCPYYELPNVFTPNGGNCNERFGAYRDASYYQVNGSETGEWLCGVVESGKCARFVEAVVFKVFNRWGKEVYDYRSQAGGENTIYIDWDGRDKEGKELASGVYYYVAEVTFLTVDPSKRNQVIKGWVHLIR